MAKDSGRRSSNRNKDDGDKKFTNVGALWRTRNGSSKVKASGTLQMDGQDGESFDILLMENDKGDNQKRPDFRIVIVSSDDDSDNDKEEKQGRKGSKGKDRDEKLPF